MTTPLTPEVLTEEEQDSLAVGEELMEQQENLLAGKYKNAQDLESAYIELQKKLGEGCSEEEEEVSEEPESDDDVDLCCRHVDCCLPRICRQRCNVTGNL